MRPGRGSANVSLHCEIPSRLREVDALCREVRTLLADHGLGGTSFPVELLAREWLNNAIIHGNERDEEKRVGFHMGVGRKWIWLQVIDEGPGFDWRKARRAPPPDDTSPSGRGLFISAQYAQKITFNQRGNRITVWLKKKNRGGPKNHGRVHDRTQG